MKNFALVLIVFICVLCNQPKNAQYYFDEGKKSFEKGEFDMALSNYQEGLKLEPKSEIGYNLLGMVCRFKFNQTRDPEWRKKEIASFEEALRLNPDFVPALINLGATYYYSGARGKAAPYFKHALEVYPAHPESEALKKMIAEGEEDKKD